MRMRQQLTTMGKVGLGFFCIGPVAFFWHFFLNIIGINLGGILPIIMFFMCGASFFASFPMMLLGREWVIDRVK